MEFTVGDRVRYKRDDREYTIVCINLHYSFPYLIVGQGTNEWVRSDVIEIIPKTPKELLEVGMVVECKNGILGMILKNSFHELTINFGKGYWKSISAYNDDLCTDSDMDIIKIYGFCDYNNALLEISTDDRKLIWKRKPDYKEMRIEDIERELGYKIKIIGDE